MEVAWHLEQAALLVEAGLGLTEKLRGSPVGHKPSRRTAARGDMAKMMKGEKIGPLPLLSKKTKTRLSCQPQNTNHPLSQLIRASAFRLNDTIRHTTHTSF